MASEKAVREALRKLVLVCTNPPEITEEVVGLWQEVLEDIPDVGLEVAVRTWLRQSKWFPAPADLWPLARMAGLQNAERTFGFWMRESQIGPLIWPEDPTASIYGGQ